MRIIKILFLIFVLPIGAYDDRPKCYKELERNFFDYTVSAAAFDLWNVPQGLWRSIMSRLNEHQSEVEEIVKKKSEKYKPNPIQNPFQSDVAKLILKETLYQIFIQALIDSGFSDSEAIDRMFEYIWDNNPKQLNCH